MIGGDPGVDVAQEIDGLEVLVAAMTVRNPFAGLARIVQIQHRGDRIDAQRIDMEPVDPIKGAGLQEIRDLATAEIVDQGIPVLVEALTRVRMFVKRGAVELRQPMRIRREMCRHPVHDDADARLVQTVHQPGEGLGGTKATGRREKTDGLISP